jgi:hypothetical protein
MSAVLHMVVMLFLTAFCSSVELPAAVAGVMWCCQLRWQGLCACICVVRRGDAVPCDLVTLLSLLPFYASVELQWQG